MYMVFQFALLQNSGSVWNKILNSAKILSFEIGMEYIANLLRIHLESRDQGIPLAKQDKTRYVKVGPTGEDDNWPGLSLTKRLKE